MPKGKRIFGTLSIAVIACAVYLWFFGPQTFFAINSRRIGREIPIVKSAPVELRDLDVSQVKGERLSFKGVEFEVPWTDVDENKSRIAAGWAVIYFRSGNSMILCVNEPKDLMSGMFLNKSIKPELFTSLYGPDVLKSDYTLQKAIFETTPSQINILTPSNRAAGLSSVLIIKAIMPPTTDWAIYSIHTKNYKGFQLGDPQRRPKKMSLELYGENVDIEINIEQIQSTATSAITQSEINRILQSAHEIPNAQPVLTVTPG